MTLRERIAAAAEKLRRTGGDPRQVHLTKADASQLTLELMAEGGTVGQAVMRDGIRKAVTQIWGLEIVWRSASFRVT